MKYAWMVLILGLVGGGCAPIVPAKLPPQLAHTPAPSVIIGDGVVRDASFVARYPRTWRVVKLNAAHEPTRFAFISPDDTLYLFVSLVPPEGADADAPLQASVKLAGATVWLWGRSEGVPIESLSLTFDDVKASISTP